MSKSIVHIQPNWFNITYCWTFFLGLLVTTIASIVLSVNAQSDMAEILMLVLGTSLMIMLTQFAWIVFRHPYRISMDNVTGELVGARLIGKAVRFNVAALKGYSRASVWMNEENHRNLILYFRDGRKLELSELIVRPIELLSIFLRKRGIDELGTETSWFPFQKLKYRYQR